jgi:hypothetical protein
MSWREEALRGAESGEEAANFRVSVDGKTRCESIPTMNFLSASNEIHSP